MEISPVYRLKHNEYNKKLSEIIKNMPNDLMINDPSTGVSVPLPTVKRCTGINELYNHGAIIPFWTDAIFQPKDSISGKSNLVQVDDVFEASVALHPREQFTGLFPNHLHVKFAGAWNLVEKQGIKFVWLPAAYNLNVELDNFLLPPAITFYDYQCQTNVNMFVRKDAPDFILRAGTPLIQIIPLTERPVEYKCHLVSIEEWRKKNTIPLNFPTILGTRNNRYFKWKAESEKLDKMEESGKCPFGFGKK